MGFRNLNLNPGNQFHWESAPYKIFLGGGGRDRISLYFPGWSGTPGFPPQLPKALGLQACATVPGQDFLTKQIGVDLLQLNVLKRWQISDFLHLSYLDI